MSAYDEYLKSKKTSTSSQKSNSTSAYDLYLKSKASDQTKKTDLSTLRTSGGNIGTQKRSEGNPTILEDKFLYNTFPIKKNDNIAIKGLKGAGNAAISTLAAPIEVIRKGAITAGNVVDGKGLQLDKLPKTTSFINDILPKSASTSLDKLEQNHPVLGGLAKTGIEIAADPTAWVSGGMVKNALNPLAKVGKIQDIKIPTNVLKGTESTTDAVQETSKATAKKVETPAIKAAAMKAETSSKVETPSVKAKTNKLETPAFIKAKAETPVQAKAMAKESTPTSKSEEITLYHGGNVDPKQYDVAKASGVSELGKGFYASDAKGLSEEWAKERGGKVYEVKVNTKNFFDEYNVDSTNPKYQSVKDKLVEAGLNEKFVENNFGGSGTFTYFAKALNKSGVNGNDKMADILKESGFDGAIAGLRDSKQYVSYINENIVKDSPNITQKDLTKSADAKIETPLTKLTLPELKITSKINKATQEKIFEARPTGRLTPKDLIKLKPEMDKLGGFYSKTNRTFVFDKDPTTELKKLADVAQKEVPIEEKLLANSDNWKDKATISYNRETLERNLEDIAGADAPALIKEYVEPRQKNVADMTRFLNTERGELKQLNIKPRSKDSQLLMEYGEGRITLSELKSQTSNWDGVSKANTELRQKYDKYLNMANEVLERNGYDPIPRRDNYFTHFQEISDKLEMFGIPNNKLPTDINGLTADFKPGKTFFASALERKGDETALDAMAGIDKYLDGISKVIYLTDDIQRLRGLETAIRKKYGEGSKQLSNFVANLREYTNNLAGKKSMSDRGMESDLGRNVYRAADALKKQVGANAIGFNIASTLTNFIPLTQSLATTSKPAFVKGMMETLANVFKNDGFIESSDFLTRRFGSDPLSVKLWTTRTDIDKLTKTLGNIGATYSKGRDAGYWIFGVADKFVAQTIVRGKYNEFIAKGLTPKEALKKADNWGVRIMADRSIGAQANFFNKKGLMGAVTQFQTEVNNQLSFIFKDIPRSAESKAAAASAIGQVFLFGYLFNELYEKAIGRRPAFDPIGVIQKAYEDYTNSELTDKEATKNLATNVANQLPFASMFLEEGGRIPLTESLPNPMNALNGTSTVNKELTKIPKLILPTGGGQIKKTLEGTTALNLNPFKKQELPGKYKETAEGKQLVYPIAPTTGNKIKATLFGQYAPSEAREYYGNTRTPLTVKQTGAVETMAKSGADPKVVYDQLLLLRPLTKKADEIKSINLNKNLTPPQKLLLKKLIYTKEQK